MLGEVWGNSEMVELMWLISYDDSSICPDMEGVVHAMGHTGAQTPEKPNGGLK